MTNCLSEEWIEQLAIDHIRDPGGSLPEHLSSCAFCNAGFKAMLALHQTALDTLEATEIDTLTTQVESILHCRDEHVWRLQAVESLPFVSPRPAYQKILAADTGQLTQPVSKVTNIGVFSTADGELIVRILKGTDGKVSLFLLSDHEDSYKHVLVRILGLDREYVTDSNGCAYLGAIELSGILELGLEVKTATDIYDLKTIFQHSDQLIGESEIMLSGTSNRKIKMEIIPAGSLYSLRITLAELTGRDQQKQMKVMVVRGKHVPLLKSSVRGVALFQELQDPRTIQVKIFE